MAPEVVLCLGATPGRVLLGRGFKLDRERGRWATGPGGIIVLPTYNPAYLLRLRSQATGRGRGGRGCRSGPSARPPRPGRHTAMTSESTAQLAAQFARYVVPTLMPVAVRVVRIAAVEPRDAVLGPRHHDGTRRVSGCRPKPGGTPRSWGWMPRPPCSPLPSGDHAWPGRSTFAGVSAAPLRWNSRTRASTPRSPSTCCTISPGRTRRWRRAQRVLAPGGRLALAVWGRAVHNPWAALVARAAGVTGQRLVRPRPDVFSLGSPGAVEILLQHAGFVAIESERVRDKLRWRDAADLWRWYTGVAAHGCDATGPSGGYPRPCSTTAHPPRRAVS